MLPVLLVAVLIKIKYRFYHIKCDFGARIQKVYKGDTCRFWTFLPCTDFSQLKIDYKLKNNFNLACYKISNQFLEHIRLLPLLFQSLTKLKIKGG